MKRYVAVLLLAVFAFWLSAPALLAQNPESHIAPCCRKDGKHHCSANQHNSGPGYSTRICSEGLPSNLAQPSAKIVSTGPVGCFVSIVTQEPAIQAQPKSRCHISLSRSSQKRGPPSLL
jgi:hypothetical protein